MKVGIVGCGKIAQTRHIPEYTSNNNCTICGYYDFNQERAIQMSKKYGGKVYSSAKELFLDPSLDAVSICVTNSEHAKLSIEALNEGKHVLCEKPMATTEVDCKAMVETAKQNGKILMIGQNQRFTKAHQKAKELVAAGEIGKILTFQTTFGHSGPETWSIDKGNSTWFFNKNLAAMGAMADLGVHKTDLIRFLLDSDIARVQAVLTTLEKKDDHGKAIGVDDNAFCIYQLENDVIGTMTASWTYYGDEDNSTILYGDKGIMKIYDDPKYSIKITLHTKEQILYEIDKIQTNDTQTKSGIIDAFIDAILNGQEPESSGRDVLNSMKAVFAAIKSSETRRLEEVI